MKTIFFICLFLLTTLLFSQHESSIEGTVTDEAMNSEPLLFATIQLKGSNISYQTNFHGNFEISDIKPGSYTLLISYAGYETEEVIVAVAENTITKIDTPLAPIQISFDDVKGMGTVLKEVASLTTSVEKSPKK